MQKIFLFGDSITAGYYQHEITDLLTAPIQRSLPNAKVVNAGIPGDTTVDGLARIERFILRYDPTYVTVFFGANDADLACPLSVDDYQANLRTIISRIGWQKVLLLSAPYTSQRDSQARLERIKSFVDGAEAVAQETGVHYINMLDEMMQQADPESLLQEDGLHFSLEGYDFLAELILSGLKQIRREKE